MIEQLELFPEYKPNKTIILANETMNIFEILERIEWLKKRLLELRDVMDNTDDSDKYSDADDEHDDVISDIIELKKDVFYELNVKWDSYVDDKTRVYYYR
jgi:hypothetical protein